MGLGTSTLSAKQFGVHLVIEPDQQRLARTQSRGSQVSGGAEHGCHGSFGNSVPEVEFLGLFPLGYHQSGDGGEQFASVCSRQFFTGGNGLTHGELAALQKAGGLATAGSAVAVVVPVDGFGHD
jgi:hypothetical protein